MPVIAVSYRLSLGAEQPIVHFRRVKSMEGTHTLRRVLVGTVMATVICGGLWATMGSGTSSVLVGPPTTYEGFKVKRDAADGWAVKIEAKDGLSIATQMITFQPGGQSGWHSHPGPVFISVKEGTMTFYDQDCNATVLTAGQGFLDVGADRHLARNESGSPAINVVTYFVPPHTTVLRIDAPQPPNCFL
jgi:quercetin dioxygenase-like cupin family protein